MAASPVEICNQALAHLGNGKQIAALTDKSNEARACTLFYERCRDEVLAAFPWGFATRSVALSLVEEQPNDEWAYSYRYPPDALTVVRLPSGVDRVGAHWCEPMTLASPTPFRIVSDATGKLIYTDLPNATVEYTARVEDVTQFAADFVAALALKLAGDMAPLVTGGDPTKLGLRALQRYDAALSDARTRNANEERTDRTVDSDLLRSRY